MFKKSCYCSGQSDCCSLILSITLSLLSLSIFSAPCHATRVNDVLNKTGEQRDAALDIHGQEKGKWLPVPLPVSNPTIGSGLQAALLYLHPKNESNPESPNATSGIGGMWTDTDSTVVGLFHDNYFLNDRFRFRGLIGRGDLNMQYFGIGDSLVDFSIDFNIKVDVSMLQFSTRLPATESWYIGLRHLWIDANTVFDLSTLSPVLPDITDDITSSSLSMLLTYDTRDNNYYARNGSYFEAVLAEDNEDWGSDYNFRRNSIKYTKYLPFTDKQTLALKAAISDVDGGAPFFLLSTLNMRGFATGRYLDNSSISLHSEWRYKFHPRWGVVAFAEAGKIGNSISNLDERETITSYGTGLRWQAINSKQMHIGIDIAFSEDDDTVYLRVGEAF